MGRLDEKVVLITGAARGTGAATARVLVDQGARVVICDVLDELGQGVADDLGDAAVFVHLDVTVEADWIAAIEAATNAFGGLDVLVNNAAILDVGAIVDMDADLLSRLIAVNQIGPYIGIKHAVAPMSARNGGSIINVASIDAMEGSNGVAAYTSSKWGLRGLTKAAAMELGCHGIRVNTVCPGAGSEEMVRPFVDAAIERLSSRTERLPDRSQRPFNREGTLEDIANAIAWLASDESSYVSGIDLVVDGAWTVGKIEPGAPFS
jgi:3alpha(or 20beta)-hydroxysteroid dehydrogenase